jgi:hypothetical protein
LQNRKNERKSKQSKGQKPNISNYKRKSKTENNPQAQIERGQTLKGGQVKYQNENISQKRAKL